MFFMKYDFTKIISYLKDKKLKIYFFLCIVITFFIYNIHYVMITKQYILLIINFAFGLCVYIVLELIIGKKVYYAKLNINHPENRKNNNIEKNINSEKRKNNKK